MRHSEILGLLHYLLSPGEEPLLGWAGNWELAYWVLVLLVTGLLVLFRPLWIVRAENQFRLISQHRAACAWGLIGLVIGVRTLLLPLIPIPVPAAQDEYSYLLGSDTFASGRLTNPPHPMWQYFETFHINMHPTYQSMYPPVQALLLALGQWLTGQPWIGVLLSVAVMCGVFCWMLQGWMPPQWALLGGIFAAARYGVFSYWINSYWGGAGAAIGGALLVGSLPRLRRNLTWQQTIVFALGIVILMNSRPFEGVLFAAPLLLAFLWLVICSTIPKRQLITRIVLPGLMFLALALAGMLYYNWRGTGNAMQMPYVINQANYHISKPFLFQKPSPFPKYRVPQMRTFYIFHEYPDLLMSRSLWGIKILMSRKFFCYYTFMVWPLLLLFVPGLLLGFRDPELRIIVIAILVLFSGLTLQLWPAHGHYAAPAAGAFLLILLNSLRYLRNTNKREWVPWFTRAIVLTLTLWLLVPMSDRILNPYALDDVDGRADISVPKQLDRARLEAQINRLPGQHLILVHYDAHDRGNTEWVYNRADIDKSKIIWARDVGHDNNQKLLHYYPDRSIWFVDRSNGSVIMPYVTAFALTHPANALLPQSR